MQIEHLFGLLCLLPTFAVVALLPRFRTPTVTERLRRHITSGVSSIAASIGFVLLFDPTPNAWADAHFFILLCAASLVGAVLGSFPDALAIILLSVIACITYGIIHDQFTARICVEYFTIGPAPVFRTTDPTLLAFGWGVRATWWVGVLLGIPLAIAARLGGAPRRFAGSLIQPVSQLLLTVGLLAVLAGLVAWLLAAAGQLRLIGPIAARLPPDRHVPFLIDLWAHSASYLFGFLGGILLCVQAWRRRQRSSESAPN